MSGDKKTCSVSALIEISTVNRIRIIKQSIWFYWQLISLLCMISACGCCHPLLPKTLRQRILSKLFRTRKGDDLGATYSHYFDRERKFAAAAKITRRFSIKESIVMVGGSWTMATLIEHEIKPKSNLTISTVFNAKSLDTFPGIGLILSLVLWKSSFFSFVQLMQFWYLITFCWCSARKANMDSLLLQEAKGYP